MRYLILSIFLLIGISVGGQVLMTEENLNVSIAHEAEVIEDKDHALTIDNILSDDLEFTQMTHHVEVLDFNSSRWWIKISIQKPEDASNEHYILELARPITNKVFLYEVQDNKVVNLLKGGDGIHFNEKAFDHRKNLFELEIAPGEIKHYIIELESDGEVITLPIKFWEKMAFVESDYDDQFGHGFFYGLLFLVTVIFFFFYVVLKDISFLYYILYVICQMILQFTLDGYTFQYLFTSGGYLTNHIVLLSAGGAVIFITLYAKSFLKTQDRSPRFDKIFKVFVIIFLIITAIALIPGPTYELGYPLINGVSLIATLFIIYVIFALKRKGHKINNYFTLAFVILITGVVIFILSNFHLLGSAEHGEDALKISAALEVIALSVSMAGKYRELQQEKELAQQKSLENLAERNRVIDEMNANLEQQVVARTQEIQLQKEQLAEKNEDIMASIIYSQRIQEAVLPPDDQVKEILPKSFVFYRPRDIVSGDFYFIESILTNDREPLALVAAVDCTGHGVPGAFMSLIGSSYLKQSLGEPEVNSPAEALMYLNKGVHETLRINESKDVKDGMDMALCVINKEEKVLNYAGAKNPVYIVTQIEATDDVEAGGRDIIYNTETNKKLVQLKGDKHPIGAHLTKELLPFTNHSYQLKSGDVIYMFSDGFPDQFGGKKGKKYGYKSFKQFLLDLSVHEISTQEKLITEEFDAWKTAGIQEIEQLDDVLVIGIQIG